MYGKPVVTSTLTLLYTIGVMTTFIVLILLKSTIRGSVVIHSDCTLAISIILDFSFETGRLAFSGAADAGDVRI